MTLASQLPPVGGLRMVMKSHQTHVESLCRAKGVPLYLQCRLIRRYCRHMVAAVPVCADCCEVGDLVAPERIGSKRRRSDRSSGTRNASKRRAV